MTDFENKKIALLCDYGLDDAIATTYLLKNADKFKLIDIIPIGGNFHVNITFENALKILYNLHEDFGENKIRIIDTRSIIQPNEELYDIHGTDGIGDVLPKYYRCNTDIVDFCKWENEITDDYIIISLGPCTITKRIIEKNNTLPMIIMGGNIGEEPNYKGYEFNHGIDKEAFEYCVCNDHVIATMDSCHNKLCDFNQYESNCDDLMSLFIRKYIHLSKSRKEEFAYVYDLVAVIYLLHSEKFDNVTKTDKDGNKLNMMIYNGEVPIFKYI